MNIKKISGKITIRPTEKKIKKAKHVMEKVMNLPKEEPLERKIYLETAFDSFQREKEKIQLSIDNMKRNS